MAESGNNKQVKSVLSQWDRKGQRRSNSTKILLLRVESTHWLASARSNYEILAVIVSAQAAAVSVQQVQSYHNVFGPDA